MSSTIGPQLAQLEAGTGPECAQGYNNLLQTILSGSNVAGDLVTYVRSITSDNVGVITSRPLLSAFVEQFRAIANNDIKLEAG